ncbi:914_t:CDS:2 [Dentiscutata heterogama]|uniref:914_t:CDS:1 n=1 Tax=Dentiscutata heterogama TaxID=1316150 RepID=A0ACA9MJY4_9GLOM|nr:914_t:CDS:2 [Dentiscutata heterogama]
MESMSNNQPPINIISGMLEQTTLANNSIQADDIESIIIIHYCKQKFSYWTFKPHSQEFLLEIGTVKSVKAGIQRNRNDTSDSDDEDSQSIKEKDNKCKKETLSDPLDIIAI